ncbi:MAG: MBOAT family protein, partial [Gammaproteobacteria bacterium]|nr:MBOAT family protein [Gammaproteobacteria bacterium]
MLFNSPIFIFVFLPLVLAGFYATSRLFGREVTIVWLVLASLFFYGWWNPVYLLLMMASILVNFSFGYLLPRTGIGFSKRAI